MLDDQIPWCSIERTIISRCSAALIKCVEILIRLILLSDLYTRRSNTWTTALSNHWLIQRRIPVILPLRCPDSEIGLGLFSTTLTLWTVLYSSYLLSAYNLNAPVHPTLFKVDATVHHHQEIKSGIIQGDPTWLSDTTKSAVVTYLTTITATSPFLDATGALPTPASKKLARIPETNWTLSSPTR